MQKVYLIQPKGENKRISLGVDYVENSLKQAGYSVTVIGEEEVGEDYRALDGLTVYVGDRNTSTFIQKAEETGLLLYHTKEPAGEGFYLASLAGGMTLVIGGSDTGTLYGCLELCEYIEKFGKLPREIAYGDAPVFKLRGPVVGLQLTKIEPPRKTYEYPITPSRFPWFYDKQLWLSLIHI